MEETILGYLEKIEKILAKHTQSQADEFSWGLRYCDCIRQELGCDEATKKESEEDRVRRYIVGCLEASEGVVTAGLHENEKFVNNVIFRYECNLQSVCNEYSEIDAKDEAIEEELDTWTDVCVCCGKRIVIIDKVLEKIDGELYCNDCVQKHFGKCGVCQEYVPHEELGYSGNVLCCDKCASRGH